MSKVKFAKYDFYDNHHPRWMKLYKSKEDSICAYLEYYESGKLWKKGYLLNDTVRIGKWFYYSEKSDESESHDYGGVDIDLPKFLLADTCKGNIGKYAPHVLCE